MIDYKSIGDSDVTIRQRQRDQKPSRADRFAWLLIIISVAYFGVNLILWGAK